MFRANRPVFRPLSMLVLLACVPLGVAFASLKSSAPKGVDLSGRWKLSPELSEDPGAAVAIAREEMQEKNKDERKKKGRHGGSMRMPGGSGGHLPPGETVPPPGEERQPNTEKDDKDKEDKRRPEPAEADDPLERALTTPAEFAIQQESEAFVLVTPEATDTCKTKHPGQVNLPLYGATDRKCGWDKTAFVIEVEPKHGPLNTTRYEIDKESGRLLVTSELKGERIPKIQVKRVYERVEPAD